MCGCSKTLSRDEAETLIKQKYNLPQTETVKIGKNYYISQKNGGGFGPVALITGPYYSEFKQMLDGLQSKGLIIVKQTNESSGRYLLYMGNCIING